MMIRVSYCFSGFEIMEVEVFDNENIVLGAKRVFFLGKHISKFGLATINVSEDFNEVLIIILS